MKKLTKRQITEKEKSEKILNYLKDIEIASTGKIASHIGSNQYYTINLLENLLKKNIITMIKMPNSTFWELK
jgi:hypothetical protein